MEEGLQGTGQSSHTSSSLNETLIVELGGLSGAYWLNQKFRDYLEQKYAHDLPRLMEDSGKETNAHTLATFLNYCVEEFEEEKKSFDYFCPDQDDIHLRLGGDDRIKIPKADVAMIFNQVLQPIIRGVEHQIAKFNAKFPASEIQRIFFFGGLSNSDHVRNVMADVFSDKKHMGYQVDVITPPTAISEVVVAKGAILRVLREETIVKRFSRRSFGVLQDQIFDPELHGNAKPVKDVEDNVFRVQDRAVWLSRAGEQVEATVPRWHRGWRGLFLQQPSTITELLISSERTLRDGVDFHDPANAIMTVGHLNVDVVTILHRLKIERNQQTGRQLRVLQYEMRVYMDHLSRIFEIVIPGNGQFPDTWRKPGGVDSDLELGRDMIKQRVRISFDAPAQVIQPSGQGMSGSEDIPRFRPTPRVINEALASQSGVTNTRNTTKHAASAGREKRVARSRAHPYSRKNKPPKCDVHSAAVQAWAAKEMIMTAKAITMTAIGPAYSQSYKMPSNAGKKRPKAKGNDLGHGLTLPPAP
ncbi:MAG: hypothetical protein Q9220_004297 [cf. Caloplaca sp. 1 TL-2023]